MVSEAIGPAAMTGTWSVLQVFAQHENRVMMQLASLDVGYYLPLIEQVKTDAAGKRRRKWVPLIGGYVFLCWPDTPRFSQALSLQSVYGHIPVANQRGLAGELQQFYEAIKLGALLDRVKHRGAIPAGTRVRVKPGNKWAGLEGIIVGDDRDEDGRAQLVLQISMLDCAYAMPIDPDAVEKAVA